MPVNMYRIKEEMLRIKFKLYHSLLYLCVVRVCMCVLLCPRNTERVFLAEIVSTSKNSRRAGIVVHKSAKRG